ncbi:Ankyrin repeat and SOCS box 3 [Fusarium agapanthi]|uniref:Ankyrin repeat and SOCS box 3 n=1 Tax=Fusarium agapanthi TaxID=1803897 RepID=A0A9P5ECD8_9HYPO|nr:Ankyrin repeat and SOCS box 3 [Fusarium agapanthi]
MSVQEQIRFNSMGLLRSTFVMIKSHLQDIQAARKINEELKVSPLNPLKDFQVDQQHNLTYTPLPHTITLDFFTFAAFQGGTDILEAFLALPDPSKTCNLSSALCLSLLNGHIDTAKFLLSKGADPRGISCLNGLHAAARAGCPELALDFLIKWKIPADCTDADGATPAIYALYLPKKEAIGIIDILIRRGASPKMTFGDKTKTYAYYASALEKYNLASWLHQMERESFSYTMEFIRKQTQDLQLGDSQKLHSEEREAEWVDVPLLLSSELSE